MKQTPEYLAQRLEACRRLFFQYEGREHARIEREMRSGGFPDFNRRCLYARGINSGWIEKFRWEQELQRRDAETQSQNLLRERAASSVGDSKAEPPASAGGTNVGLRCQSTPPAHTGGSALNSPNTQRRDAKTQRNSRNPKNSNNSTNSTNSKNSKNSTLNDFHAWLKKVSPPSFDWDAKHLRHVIEKLQLFTEGKIKRLMIFMPPRHGKSELVTTRYTAWRLMKDPTLKVILASYAQALANKFSRNIRNTLAEHFALEKVEGVERVERVERVKSQQNSNDSQDSQDSPDYLSNPFRSQIINSAAEWETGKGGGVKAVGVGGGITGYGAGLMMIDDPIKSREQAESQAYRDKVWHWFNDDMMTRLEPDAGVILIQTRWHEDDLAGRLLKQQQEEGGDEWHVISLPAIAETVDSRQWAVDSAGSGSPPYEGGVDAASADGVVLSRAETETPVKMMPARHLAFTTLPPYIPGKTYGEHVRERKEAKEELQRRDAETQRQTLHNKLAADNTDNSDKSNISDSASSATSAFNFPPDPLGRKPGEPLWPERFDLKHLEKIKRQMGSYSFEALYQQKPVPTEGGLFKRSWFINNIVQTAPPNLNWKRGYDLSFTANPDSDPSATLKVAYDKDGTVYIDGCFTGKLNYPLQRKMLMHYIKSETRTEHGIELSANGHAILQDLRQMPELRGKKFRGVKVDSNKLTRALPWIALAEEGRVRLVAGRWNEDFIQEACSFPHGHHDDQIDAVSVAIKMHGSGGGKRFWTF